MHICSLSVPTDRQTLLGVSFRFLILILKVSQPSPLGGMETVSATHDSILSGEKITDF